jgi:hypothetical protein
MWCVSAYGFLDRPEEQLKEESLAATSILFAPGQATQENQTDAPSGGIRAEYEAIIKEYNDAQAAFMKEYQTAKTDEERQKLFTEKYPKPQKYMGRLMELARKAPKDPVSGDALIWIVQFGQGQDQELMTEALDRLLADHLDHPRIGQLTSQLAYGVQSKESEFLQTLIAKSPSRDVRGRAMFALAMRIEMEIRMVEFMKNDPVMRKRLREVYGDRMEELEKKGVAQLEQEAEQLFERVREEYGGVKSDRGRTLAEQAERSLFALRNLAVGKVAPEIEGEDLDGKPMKLSDYRGKVVVLDFWGDW